MLKRGIVEKNLGLKNDGMLKIGMGIVRKFLIKSDNFLSDVNGGMGYVEKGRVINNFQQNNVEK